MPALVALLPLRVKLNTGRVLRYTIVYCAARGTLQSPRSSSRSASAHDRLARVAGSQFLTVESSLPLVSFLPSELKHTDLISAECPLRGIQSALLSWHPRFESNNLCCRIIFLPRHLLSFLRKERSTPT